MAPPATPNLSHPEEPPMPSNAFKMIAKLVGWEYHHPMTTTTNRARLITALILTHTGPPTLYTITPTPHGPQLTTTPVDNATEAGES